MLNEKDKLVKTNNEIIECYFTDQNTLAYRAYLQVSERFESLTTEQCYDCNVFVSGETRLKKHLQICSKRPGITYKFNKEHLTTFEENFKLLGHLPFTVYFDLETNCVRKLYEDFTDPTKNMYPISYCFVIAFNSVFYLNKITVLRSLTHTIENLADVSYLTNDMLRHRDPLATSQLLGCVQNVASKKSEYSFIEMFCCKLKFTVDIYKKWVYEKFTRIRLSLDLMSKQKFKKENPLCYDNPCIIWGFQLGTAKICGPNSNKMTYYDFMVKKEHYFLRNIFTKRELQTSYRICNL